MNHIIKLLKRVMDNRLRKLDKFKKYQFRYMPRSTTQEFIVLRTEKKKFIESGDFIDLENACDQVKQELIWRALRPKF